MPQRPVKRRAAPEGVPKAYRPGGVPQTPRLRRPRTHLHQSRHRPDALHPEHFRHIAALLLLGPGVCPSNNRDCDGMDFGGHQEAATRSYRAEGDTPRKPCRRGRSKDVPPRRVCQRRTAPGVCRKHPVCGVVGLIFTRVAIGPTPCIRSISGTSQLCYYLDRLHSD